jgi:hypothetical protein
MKTEGGSVQLLISSSDGSSITYSLDPGQAGYVEQLDNVLDTFKSQGSWMPLYLLSGNGSTGMLLYPLIQYSWFQLSAVHRGLQKNRKIKEINGS